MANVSEDRQKEDVGELAVLFQLDARDIGAPTIYYFTNTVLSDGSQIVFDGNTYTYIDIEATGFEVTGDGEQPQPTLKLGIVDQIVRQTLRDYNDLLGSSLTRMITLRKHLDDGTDPDPLAFFGANSFTLDQKADENKRYVEWQLATPLDHLDLQLPQGIMTRRYCSLIYRYWNGTQFVYTKATCPYVGANNFDKDNNSTTSANDVCNKQLTGCQARFPNQPLPINIFPGLGDVQ
jgi:lambda family phage minor tail protein L